LLANKEEWMSALAVPTVLTVEDDPIVRADLRLILEDAGFSVCADAGDGFEAVKLARVHRPDVILLDLGLPHLDGAEAAHRIRREREVPIVALTGYREGRLLERAVAAGASTLVHKPFAEEEVVDAVRDALTSHSETKIQAGREQSRKTLASIVTLLGYPEDFADYLEQQSFARGKVWRPAD
jgi:CheY-like chemotaxis protein